MARIRRGSSARRARVGDVIKGQYKILQVIGAGGMSRVYLASDLQLTNKMWAIKEVDRHATDPAGRPIEQSLAREADLPAGLELHDAPRLVGRAVRDERTGARGVIDEVMVGPANDVWVLRGELGELLLPVIPDVVDHVPCEGDIEIRIPAGLDWEV